MYFREILTIGRPTPLVFRFWSRYLSLALRLCRSESHGRGALAARGFQIPGSRIGLGQEAVSLDGMCFGFCGLLKIRDGPTASPCK